MVIPKFGNALLQLGRNMAHTVVPEARNTNFERKILFSRQVRLLACCRLEREKFYPEPGFEPRSLVLRASALTTELSRKSTNP